MLGKIRFFDSISSIIGQKVREKNKDPGDLLVAIRIDLIEIFWHNKDDCAVIHWRKFYPVYSQSCLLEQIKLLKNVSLVHPGNCVACQEYTLGRLCTPSSPAVSLTFERASVSKKHGIWRIQQQHFKKLSAVNLVQLFFWPELTFVSSSFVKFGFCYSKNNIVKLPTLLAKIRCFWFHPFYRPKGQGKKQRTHGTSLWHFL